MNTFKDAYGHTCIAIDAPKGSRNSFPRRYRVYIGDRNEVWFHLEEYHGPRQTLWGPGEGWRAVENEYQMKNDYSVLPGEVVLAAAKLLKLNVLK